MTNTLNGPYTHTLSVVCSETRVALTTTSNSLIVEVRVGERIQEGVGLKLEQHLWLDTRKRFRSLYWTS